MIGLRVTVPIACWRKGHAREYLETEALPPPATCYGFLLSLVGEEDRHRHRGVRVTAGLVNSPEISVVLRTLWRVKSLKEAPGVGSNARPDYQQLVVNAELVVWCDSTAEPEPSSGLESRVGLAIREPARNPTIWWVVAGRVNPFGQRSRDPREGGAALAHIPPCDGRRFDFAGLG